MPHDLFGDAAARPSVRRSRRSPLVLVSVCLHASLLLLALAASILAPDVLPFPRKVLAFYDPVAVKLVDIDLPAPRRPARTASPQPPDAVAPNAAPVITPSGIAEETGREALSRAALNRVEGTVDGFGSSVISAGVAAAVPLPPPPAPSAPIRLHSGMRAPVKLTDAAPVYPALARQAHVEGVVILETTIDASGQVQEVRVLRSVALLDSAAVDAVRQWRYEPALLNGQAVAVIMTVTVRFTLN